MKKITGSFVAVVVVALFLAGCGDNAKDQKKDDHKGPEHGAASPADTAKIAQKICPVMGKKIDPKLFVDHKGRRVYFCCKMCVETFKKDPGKYIKKVDGSAAKPATGGSGHKGN